jgi:hypothetical protein
MLYMHRYGFKMDLVTACKLNEMFFHSQTDEGNQNFSRNRKHCTCGGKHRTLLTPRTGEFFQFFFALDCALSGIVGSWKPSLYSCISDKIKE